jgi:transcriptional regulator with XRE-family HTH domain
MPARPKPKDRRTRNTEAIGRAIRDARRARGFASHEKFAAHVGLDRSYVGAIERGEFNISLETIVKLAVALEMPAADLIEKAGFGNGG